MKLWGPTKMSSLCWKTEYCCSHYVEHTHTHTIILICTHFPLCCSFQPSVDTSLLSSGDRSIYNGSWYWKSFLHISPLKLLFRFIIKFSFFHLNVYLYTNASWGITCHLFTVFWKDLFANIDINTVHFKLLLTFDLSSFSAELVCPDWTVSRLIPGFSSWCSGSGRSAKQNLRSNSVEFLWIHF